MKTFRDFGIDIEENFSGEKYTTCPKCSPTRKKKNAKCLSVNGDKKVWHCHHPDCGWVGSLKNGEQELLKDDKIVKPVWQDSQLPQKVIDYFAARQIPEQKLKDKGIGYGPIWMPQENKRVNAIQFPYKRDGEVVNIKYRDGRKNFRQVAGAEKIVYNLDRIKNSKSFICTEGEIDTLTWELLELDCISVPDGAPAVNTKNYESKFTYLECIEEHIKRAEKIYLAFDSDEPGQKLEEEISRRIGREKCWRVRYPSDCKDANEVACKHDLMVLYECYANAEPYPVPGLISVESLRQDVLNLYYNGLKRGQSTGWDEFDKFYSIRSGEVTVIQAAPNVGKTTMIKNLFMNLAINPGWMFVVFSPEDMPLQNNVASMIEVYARKPFSKYAKNRVTEKEVEQSLEFISEHFQFVYPPENNFHVDFILDTIKASVFRNGAKAFVIDPWNYLEYTRPNGVPDYEFVGHLLQKVKMFCVLCDVHGFIVLHPRKLDKRFNKKTGKEWYGVPTPYDGMGSSHFFNKADNWISIWRDTVNKVDSIQVHIQKIRFKEIGRLGMVEFDYNREDGRLIPKNISTNGKHEQASLPYKDDEDDPALFEKEDDKF